jgi:hypothetical protein
VILGCAIGILKGAIQILWWLLAPKPVRKERRKAEKAMRRARANAPKKVRKQRRRAEKAMRRTRAKAPKQIGKIRHTARRTKRHWR